MKYSENWLREWVNPNLKLNDLANILTMSGIEVEEIIPAAENFTGVIVGKIVELKDHRGDKNLKICTVDVGVKKLLQIVCGATNVHQNAKVAVALDGAQLPHNLKIKTTTINNIQSEGMLCSAQELSLAEKSEGILLLPDDAPIGAAIRDYFQLNDYLLNLSITPNRGDCLSIRGIAREISAITQSSLLPISLSQIEPQISDTLPIKLQAADACPHYVGRIIKNVNAQIPTPIWIVERLRRSGTRSINVIVDIMNYVMYELGQPLHAFDLGKINSAINVRMAKHDERLLLLDGSEKILNSETLIIADKEQPLAIAGLMGGMESGVSFSTKNIFLESAYFTPETVGLAHQKYNLTSEAAYRFERGVDPTIQQEAIERATQLILEIAGGKVGPIIDVIVQDKIPLKATIKFTSTDIYNILGIKIADEIVTAILNRLSFNIINFTPGNWEVIPPVYRFDIVWAEDVIEEIARLYGYENIPMQSIKTELSTQAHISDRESKLRRMLAYRGFHEIITYSFIDKELANLLLPNQALYHLSNPISLDMSVMRPSLLPGLVQTWQYNSARQQNNVRLFEIGTCFRLETTTLNEISFLGGLISGNAYPEQWGTPNRKADFYDLKGDIEALLSYLEIKEGLQFKPLNHPTLHPGQSASIFFQDQLLGYLGNLHPALLQQLNIKSEAIVFEINLSSLPTLLPPHYEEVSKFPEIRRDLAFLINQAIPAKEIQDTIKMIVGDWLKDVFIFDVYQGKGIKPGQKSIALALILQDSTRTLVDEEVADLMKRVIDTLKGQLGAELRS